MHIFYFWTGGLGFYGGLIGGALGLFLFCRIHKEPVLFWADRITLPLSLGYMIGRLACLFHGCCYGKFCTLPWALKPEFSLHERHPTQLYFSLWELLIFSGLFFIDKKTLFTKRGLVFSMASSSQPWTSFH